MKRRRVLEGTAAAAGMLVLILDSRTALNGAAQGLDLCIRTVIPSLFPFILLSNLLTGAFSGIPLRILGPLGRLFSMPKGTEALLIPAFLGGYPVGAQCIGSAYAAGRLKKQDAQRMLAFCSNAGPSFLFGMVGAMFPKKTLVWVLWSIQIASALMVSAFFPCSDSRASLPEAQKSAISPMASALRVMGSICGWVVIFRVLIAFLQRWFLWLLSKEAQVVVMGILELSNGCCALGIIENDQLRFVLASGLLSFGGICVLLQTASVTKGLSLKDYLIGKSLQGLFSTVLAVTVINDLWPAAAAAAVLFLVIPRKMRKNSSNPLSVGV